MNVRGDQHLNFTPEEAAAWLGQVPVRYPAPVAADDDEGIAAMFGIVAILVLSWIIYASISAAIHTETASEAPKSSLQSRTPAREEARGEETPTREAAPQENTSQNAPPSVAYVPAGWFLGHMIGPLSLHDRQGRNIGALPDGAMFFGTTEASGSQLIVPADGGSWGYGAIKLPQDLPASPVPIQMGFEKALRLIGELEASGIAAAFRREITQPQRQPTAEQAYLPTGWMFGCLTADGTLTDGLYGPPLRTIPKDTCLILQIANAGGKRMVVAADGSFWGYACLHPAYVPRENPMRPELETAVAIIHRLENGSAAQ
jgi:hypothetical protein